MKGLLALYRYYVHADVMYDEWHRYSRVFRRPTSQTPETLFPAPAG